MNVWVLTEFTLREAFRRRVVLLAGIVALAFLALYGLGVWFGYDDLRSSSRLTGSERTLVISFMLSGGLWSLNFVASLLAIFLSVGAIAGEIEHGTLHAVAARPVRRREIVVGKFLGYAVLIATFIAVTAGAAMAIVGAITGYVPERPWAAPLLMLAGALVLLTLTLAGSSRLSTLGNGVVVFTLYAIGLVGGIIEQIGSALGNAVMFDLGIFTSVLVPTRALWDMASAQLRAPGVVAGPFGSGPVGSLNPPSGWMLLVAGLYAAVMLSLAIRQFSRRDI